MNPITSPIKRILAEVDGFQTRQIQIVPQLYFNQYETVNTIFFYYNSKFTTGDFDDEGDRKYFYNVSKNPCKIFTKSIDFDTKSIKLLTAEGGDPAKTWFMERDLKYWMRDIEFGKTLNRIFYELPIFGTVVLKVIEGVPYFVDLRNFIVEQSADDLDKSSYIIEVYNMTVGEFKKTADKMGWKAADVKEVLDRFAAMKGVSHIRLLERYGDILEKDGSFSYKRTFVADVGYDEYTVAPNERGQMIIRERGVLLSSEDWDDNPYWEFHTGKIGGRWLGVGVVESLFEPQIRHNELANLQAKTSYWAALRVFQSRDTAINKNLKTDTKSGDVLSVDSEITQIDMSDRNLAFFNEETAKWNKNINDMTIAFAPVGHSVIAIRVAMDQVVSYFEQIQENVAMDIKEMIYEDIIPQFERDMTTEHMLRLVGQDLDTYIDMIKNQLVNHQVVDLVLQGKFPTNADRDAIEIAVAASIKQGKEKLLTIPKGFYKDVKYDVDIDITGESIDTKERYAALFAALQAITTDPSILTDPTKKKILSFILEEQGISPNDIFADEPSAQEALLDPNNTPAAIQGRAGGGVSAPNMMNMGGAGMGRQTTTI